MSTPIDNVMKIVRKNLAEKQRQDKETQEKYEQHKRETEAAVLSLALNFVPDFMRPYATMLERFSTRDATAWRVIFTLPECAPIMRRFRVDEFDKEDGLPCSLYPVAVNSQEYYSVSSWRVFEDEIVPEWQGEETFDDLDQALIRALERGDNRAQCERFIRERQQRWDERQAEAEARKKLPLCPLKFAKSDAYCDTDQCAWFISFAHQDACALKVIAQAMPFE